MIPLLAEATGNSSDVITWGVILVLTTIAANVAVIIGTRRSQKRDVTIMESAVPRDEFLRSEEKNRQDHQIIFKRLDNVSIMEGRLQAFNEVFEKFTRIVESQGRANTETMRGFTEALQTFADVMERRDRNKP